MITKSATSQFQMEHFGHDLEIGQEVTIQAEVAHGDGTFTQFTRVAVITKEEKKFYAGKIISSEYESTYTRIGELAILAK